MGRYLLQRIMYMIPTFFLVTLTVFLLLSVAPGDTVDAMFSEASPNQADKDRFRREYNLDKPVYVQYALWMGKLAQGDLGTSLTRQTKVWNLIKERWPNTFFLSLLSLTIGWCIAIPVGIIAAVKAESAIDHVARGFAVLLLAVPAFWVAVLFLTVPAFLWGIAPKVSFVPFSTDPVAFVTYFIVPAFILGTTSTGTALRMTRAMMLEVMSADYIRTARAKGLRDRTVILKHALKNALIPVVTVIGSQTPTLVGGSVIIEQIFGVPGVGSLMLSAIQTKDFPVVQAVVVLLSIFVLIVNLLVDLSYVYLDPRIKLK